MRSSTLVIWRLSEEAPRTVTGPLTELALVGERKLTVGAWVSTTTDRL